MTEVQFAVIFAAICFWGMMLYMRLGEILEELKK